MFRLPLVTSGESITVDQFWSALNLYHDRPHLINRRILGTSESNIYKIISNLCIARIKELFTKNAILYEIRKKQRETCLEDIQANFIKNLIEPYDKQVVITLDSNDLKELDEGIFVSTRLLLPRHHEHKKAVEVIILDKVRNCATFLVASDEENTVLGPPFPYEVELQMEILNIYVGDVEHADTSSAVWLVDNLFPKLIKWATDDELQSKMQPSLGLISMERYCSLYQMLKVKYGKELVKVWPEKTDPLKFVYEDVAIAAYLITLWEEFEESKKVKFVDLGCGNGLLVYILTQEGYLGYGIDVRKRKIWDLYPKTIDLRINTITPSSRYLFSDADWIIGNHSDELTPWIPVITSRSSYNCKFFLLPCCCYEFNGKKYQRVNSSQSQYSEYIEYIKKVSEKCGFEVSIDKLRIPSTKRTCLIGTKRTYEEKDFNTVDEKLKIFIDERSQNVQHHNSSADNASDWISNFEARENVEKVRNCTQLDKTLTARIVRKIFEHILQDGHCLTKRDGSSWNSGKATHLSKLVNFIPKEDLKQLKKECGGLQTLLRNHHQIFEVKEGLVKFRIVTDRSTKSLNSKTRQCWFQENHPDGCFYDSDNCLYRHI